MNAGREGDVNRGGADSRNRNNGNGSIVSRGRADGSNGTILTNARSLYLFLPPSLSLSSVKYSRSRLSSANFLPALVVKIYNGASL